MTTAHRPTWAPAKGNAETGGARFFAPSERRMAKDLASHTRMKYRQDGQASKADLEARDLKLELEAKERAAARKRDGGHDPESYALLTAPPGPLTREAPTLVPNAADADDSDEEASGSGSDSDSDEDDTAALLAELERIKAERAEEAARRDAQRAEAEHQERAAELAHGNPLLQFEGGAGGAFGGGGGGSGSAALKRAWHEETVFKHQSRGEPVAKKRFVNDTIRSDFHKRFLARYIK